MVGGLATVAASAMPLMRAGLASNARSYSGVDLPALGLLLAGAGLTLFLSGLVHERRSRNTRLVVAGLVGGVSLGLIALLEASGALIPTSLLPTTARRFTFVMSAGVGLWIAAGMSVAVLVAHLDWGRLRSLKIHPRPLRLRSRREVSFLFLLVAVAVAVGVLRYEPWIHAGAMAESVSLPGWALPWVGPWTLLAVWLLLAAVIAAALDLPLLAASLAGFGGWIVCFFAALVAIATGTIAGLRLDELVPDSVGAFKAGADVTVATWAAFVAGLGSATLGGALLLDSQPGQDRVSKGAPA